MELGKNIVAWCPLCTGNHFVTITDKTREEKCVVYDKEITVNIPTVICQTCNNEINTVKITDFFAYREYQLQVENEILNTLNEIQKLYSRGPAIVPPVDGFINAIETAKKELVYRSASRQFKNPIMRTGLR